ncbi:hypothetical protein PC116_g16464 [Phytophthora cactorum]|uniref:Uncharacterized protein n=1 Tax=Phytophthora cactorum TaxID=29920 RepID=A0A8T1CCS1_9STRA|nr:hypothetical protein PC115_g10482 [Phytophthora cactorum]KAG3078855.1 hypothetical protein PC122_g12492 [Phytophthora cactorum]KAG4235403.1 hypothetical protein PC116_g16464 [Phytophthora cactorum]
MKRNEHQCVNPLTTEHQDKPPTLNLTACVVAFVGAVAAIAITPVDAAYCPNTLGYGYIYSASNTRISANAARTKVVIFRCIALRLAVLAARAIKFYKTFVFWLLSPQEKYK